jgi:hypothetical protein
MEGQSGMQSCKAAPAPQQGQQHTAAATGSSTQAVIQQAEHTQGEHTQGEDTHEPCRRRAPGTKGC